MVGDLHPPAGIIPREFREFVYEEMTDEEVEVMRQTMLEFDDDGELIPVSAEEFRKATRKIIGVKDIRTGRIEYNSSGITFTENRADLG